MSKEPLEDAPIANRFDLATFTDELIADLRDLRANKISVKEAHARAALAKNVLKAVHYVVMAQKFIEQRAKELPTPESK